MQSEDERLRNDNKNLAAAFREKSRKQQQTQELYDRLKRKEMTAATQSAAFDSVDDVLGALSSRREIGPTAGSQHIQATAQAQEQPRFQPFDAGFNGAKQSNFHQRRESNHSQGSGGMMPPPPPPPRRPVGHEMNGFSGGRSTVLSFCIDRVSQYSSKSNAFQSSNSSRSSGSFSRSFANWNPRLWWVTQ